MGGNPLTDCRGATCGSDRRILRSASSRSAAHRPGVQQEKRNQVRARPVRASQARSMREAFKSLEALREGVTRRNDFLNPKMTPQEIEDIVAYLNATYYRFAPQAAGTKQ